MTEHPLELKKSTAEKVRACRTLCAFANAKGGQLLFGVTPSGKLIGQRVSDHTLEELAHEFQGFEPPLFPEIERIPVTAAQEVISLRVEIPMLRPVSFRGVPYERVLNTTRVMPRASYQRLMLESLHATDRWETQPARGWTIDKLDTKEITVTLEESIRRGRSDDPGTRAPLANAIVHRDYAGGSGSIGVALYDDRLEIISPGELHFGFTPEKLLQPHESKPWNPLMAKTFYRRGHIEAWGRGTLKIAELMRAAG